MGPIKLLDGSVTGIQWSHVGPKGDLAIVPHLLCSSIDHWDTCLTLAHTCSYLLSLQASNLVHTWLCVLPFREITFACWRFIWRGPAMLINTIRRGLRPQRLSLQRLSATDSQSALESLYRANKKITYISNHRPYHRSLTWNDVSLLSDTTTTLASRWKPHILLSLLCPLIPYLNSCDNPLTHPPM